LGASVQHLFLYVLALGAGVSVVTQQLLNSSLRTALGSPAWTSVADVPWWAWSGGVFGAAFILLAILLLPSLGAATLFALVIAGQVLAAVTLDHFGAFGLTPHPIGAARLAGAVLLIAGVVLIRE
jgi:transporter family-2 protein